MSLEPINENPADFDQDLASPPKFDVEAPKPRIEPGEYFAVCNSAIWAKSYGGRKDLYLDWRIVEGRHTGKVIVQVLHPPTRGRKLRSRHRLYQQWALFLDRPPKKGERLNTTIFKGKLCRVAVRDTRPKFADGSAKPPFLAYSVVDEVKEVMTGQPAES